MEEGCSLIVAYGCHAIPGFTGITFHGPALDDVGKKLRPEWLRAWLRDPRAVTSPESFPSSEMPAFHLTWKEAASIELADAEVIAYHGSPDRLMRFAEQGIC